MTAFAIFWPSSSTYNEYSSLRRRRKGAHRGPDMLVLLVLLVTQGVVNAQLSPSWETKEECYVDANYQCVPNSVTPTFICFWPLASTQTTWVAPPFFCARLPFSDLRPNRTRCAQRLMRLVALSPAGTAPPEAAGRPRPPRRRSASATGAPPTTTATVRSRGTRSRGAPSCCPSWASSGCSSRCPSSATSASSLRSR